MSVPKTSIQISILVDIEMDFLHAMSMEKVDSMTVFFGDSIGMESILREHVTRLNVDQWQGNILKFELMFQKLT